MEVVMLIRPEAQTHPRTLAVVSTDRVLEVNALPRCEAHRTTRYCDSYERANPDKTCSMRARYRFDGVNLCGRHAGEVALAAILSGEAP